MGEVHRLIEAHGRQGALAFVEDRRVVDIAADYLADEDTGLGFLYSGWAQTALPHKRLADDQVWQVRTDHASLLVEPGRKPTPDGGVSWVGVPYGSRARLIMLYLQTEALRTQSREIELGKSLRAWLSKMGIPVGGKSIADIRDQAERIARCRLSFEIKRKGSSSLVQQLIIEKALFTDQGSLGVDSTGGPEIVDSRGSPHFLERTKLSESFYEQLLAHPFPIEEAAIRGINRHSMALDIYCWLAYRLHALSAPTTVTWKALHAQFGAGNDRLRRFRETFLENLKLAVAVYPGAGIEVLEQGLRLSPSRAPVAQRRTLVAITGGKEGK